MLVLSFRNGLLSGSLLLLRLGESVARLIRSLQAGDQSRPQQELAFGYLGRFGHLFLKVSEILHRVLDRLLLGLLVFLDVLLNLLEHVRRGRRANRLRCRHGYGEF